MDIQAIYAVAVLVVSCGLSVGLARFGLRLFTVSNIGKIDSVGGVKIDRV